MVPARIQRIYVCIALFDLRTDLIKVNYVLITVLIFHYNPNWTQRVSKQLVRRESAQNPESNLSFRRVLLGCFSSPYFWTPSSGGGFGGEGERKIGRWNEGNSEESNYCHDSLKIKREIQKQKRRDAINNRSQRCAGAAAATPSSRFPPFSQITIILLSTHCSF